MDLKECDLDDLATIDLTDSFVEANINTSERFDEPNSRKTLQDVCTDFVQSFLVEKGEWVSSLHVSLKECVAVLGDMETVLEKFIQQLDRIQNDIGEVREALAKTSVELTNTRATEQVLWAAISSLVVPPELVQIVTHTNEGELGMIFQLTLRELLKYLNYRKETWKPQQSDTSERSGTCASLATGNGAHCRRSSRELPMSLTEFSIYTELLSILDSVTVFACIKARDYLSRKLRVLTTPKTNVCIQQENNLKQYAVFVHFLRSAPPLLQHTQVSGAMEDTDNRALLPYRITCAIYNEFRQQYCLIMSSLYLHKIQGYILTLNAMEYNTTANISLGSVGSTFLSGLTRAQAGAPEIVYALPSVTNMHNRGRTADGKVFQLGKRGEILARFLAPPLIPTLERAAGREHSYEETLRSVLQLLSDAVTHEYLFAFEFFAGDMSVYVDVFQPTLQFIIDYVSEVVLLESPGNVRQLLSRYPNTSVNHCARDDLYGLLMLIRLCHEYRFYMKTVRRVACLDPFFDSLLVLLWPSFKRTFDTHLVALRCANVNSLAAVTAHLRTVAERIATVHPLVRNYTELSCTLLGIALGTVLTEERLVAGDTVNRASQQPRYRSSSSSPSSGGDSADTVMGADDGDEAASPGRLVDSFVHAAGYEVPTRLVEAGANVSSEEQAHAELRQRAVEMMAEEDEADTAESQNRFVELVGNVDFLRVQVIHYIEEIAERIVTTIPSSTTVSPSAENSSEAAVMCKAYVLNQIHYMWTAAQCAVFPGKEQGGLTLADRFDFAQLREMYDTYRARVVDDVLCMYFSDFVKVARGEQEVPPAELLHIADNFLLSWKWALDAFRARLMSVIYNTQLANEVIAQVCMECLVCNTEFLKVISTAIELEPLAFAQRPLRTLVVSNHNILLHMRSFSSSTIDASIVK